ncbi:hypothetical protein Q765_06475 [Flavobacterium rivuli WB 3.3-2 = DSM 21788]|uniref:TMF family protein n=1 Tax=Flavobacterium rivuli WB 3.3-2 = DSM 21788 TaxID=1121895 RepID=A0A0A2M782_9FLAO|nr:hypothetical protein [Flavobacterium rivuli]KGO87308.1 hypothetical protein Q765_06475 [Flavobacterium rivuli WB 3.3-2 = DSM 21788]
MKTRLLFTSILIATGLFTVTAQTNSATTTITSRGLEAGTLGTGNAFFGYQAGKVNTATGLDNTFIGHQSGLNNTTGDNNVFCGNSSGSFNTTGRFNTFLGQGAGGQNTIGAANIAIGNYAGNTNITGSGNIFIGNGSGCEDVGNNVSGSIFIGTLAGFAQCTSNTLVIDQGETYTPLIWGDFANDLLKFNGKVGIGLGTAAFPTTGGGINVAAYKLVVNGGILAKEVRVATTWADYVFEDTYKLKPLAEVECFIQENGHLPNVPSAKQVEEDGIEMGNMAKIQQEKIEELTLYAIAQQKQIDQQAKELQELKALVLKMADNK